MSFSDLAQTTLTNTILMPAVTPGTAIPSAPKFASIFATHTSAELPGSTDFAIKIKSNGDTTLEPMTYCKTVLGLMVKRGHTAQKAGGSNTYSALVADPYVTYNDITLNHVATADGLFLKWLLSGAEDGYAQYAQLEITVGKKDKTQVVYTLNDAFPNSWAFAVPFATANAGTAVALLDTVSICYGSLNVSTISAK